MGQRNDEAQRRLAQAESLNDNAELSGKDVALIAAVVLGSFVVVYLIFLQ